MLERSCHQGVNRESFCHQGIVNNLTQENRCELRTASRELKQTPESKKFEDAKPKVAALPERRQRITILEARRSLPAHLFPQTGDMRHVMAPVPGVESEGPLQRHWAEIGMVEGATPVCVAQTA